MTKFWALIATHRPHIFSLGKMEDEEAALNKAEEFCKRKNDDNESIAKEKNLQIENFAEYILLAILTESDLRGLTGEVHRPLVIASPKREVAVESPTKRHGGPEGVLEESGSEE